MIEVLILYSIASGNVALAEHFEDAAWYTMYTSKTTQNDLIQGRSHKKK